MSKLKLDDWVVILHVAFFLLIAGGAFLYSLKSEGGTPPARLEPPSCRDVHNVR